MSEDVIKLLKYTSIFFMVVDFIILPTSLLKVILSPLMIEGGLVAEAVFAYLLFGSAFLSLIFSIVYFIKKRYGNSFFIALIPILVLLISLNFSW